MMRRPSRPRATSMRNALKCDPWNRAPRPHEVSKSRDVEVAAIGRDLAGIDEQRHIEIPRRPPAVLARQKSAIAIAEAAVGEPTQRVAAAEKRRQHHRHFMTAVGGGQSSSAPETPARTVRAATAPADHFEFVRLKRKRRVRRIRDSARAWRDSSRRACCNPARSASRTPPWPASRERSARGRCPASPPA